MFCKNCGKEIADQSTFCPYCGQKLTVTDAKSETEQQTAPAKSREVNSKNFFEKWRKVIIGAGIGVAALVVLLAVFGARKPVIDLSKFVHVKIRGYDGYGWADASIDSEEFTKLYGEKIKFKKSAGNGILDLGNASDTFLEAVDDEFSYNLDKREGLRNGDKVTLTWTGDAQLIEQYFNVKVKADPQKYEVSELEPVGTFDVFAGLKVTFSGTAPNGYVSCNYSGEGDVYGGDFTCSPSNGLKNGDVVVVTVGEDKVSYYAKSFGKIPEVTRKEYTVSGLDVSLTSLADFPEAAVAKLKSEAEDIVAAQAGGFGTYSTATAPEYKGYVILEPEDDFGSTMLYMIYGSTVTDENESFFPATVYYPVRFESVLVSGDTVEFEGMPELWNAYRDPMTCYRELLEWEPGMRVAECGDGFEVYADFDGTIHSLTEISDDYKAMLHADAKKRIENYIAEYYEKETVVEGLTVRGDLLRTREDALVREGETSYIVVYSAELSHTEDAFKPITVYYPVLYTGILKLPMDQYMVLSNDGIQGNSPIPDSLYSTDGYVSGADMYQELVDYWSDMCTFDISESLQELF